MQGIKTMNSTSFHRHTSSIPSVRKEQSYSATRQKTAQHTDPQETKNAQVMVARHESKTGDDASENPNSSRADKSNDTRASAEEIKDAEWEVKYYTDQLINASTSKDQIMYHKILKKKEAHLDALKAENYSYSHPSTSTYSGKPYSSSFYSNTHSGSSHSNNSLSSSSLSNNTKAIKDLEFDINYYTDKLIAANSSADKVMYYELLQKKEAELKSLKELDYSSGYNAHSTHSSNPQYSSAVSSNKQTPSTPLSVTSTNTSKPHPASSSVKKVSQAEIDKAKDDVAHYTKKVSETQVSPNDINQVKDDVNHYAMKVSQTKVSQADLDKAEDDVEYYEKKFKETKVTEAELDKAEDDVEYYANKCHQNKVSAKDMEKAEDDVDYFSRKCYQYPKHSPQYATTYNNYLDEKDDLASLQNKKSLYAGFYSSYVKSKDHLDDLKADKAAHGKFSEKLADSKTKLTDLESQQATHKQFATKLTDSKKKLSDLEKKQESHTKFSEKLASSKKTLSDLESKKAASSTSSHSTASSKANSQNNSATSSAHQSKKPNAEMEKVMSDMEYYKEQYIGSSKGSSHEKYYLDKYIESSGKLDELKKKDDADFHAALNPKGKVTQSDIDSAQKEYDYFNNKLDKSSTGSKEYDFYLDQSVKAKMILNALKDHQSSSTEYTSSSATYKSSVSTAIPVSTPDPVIHSTSSISTNKPTTSQAAIDKAKADMEHYQSLWYADTKNDSLWDLYWGSKKKLEKLENPAQIIPAGEVNANTPSYQAPVPKSKTPMDAQAQIDELKKLKNSQGFADSSDYHAYKTKLDKLEKQKEYEAKLSKMEADTGDLTPPTGHNHLKADYVISSHGSYKAADGWVDLPPGIFIRTNAKHGSPINNGLGWALEEDRASSYRFSELWTNKIRNYTITKESDFENNANAKIIQVPIPQKEQHILDIIAPYVPTNFDPKRDKPIIFDAAFCLADSTSDNYDYTFGVDGPSKK